MPIPNNQPVHPTLSPREMNAATRPTTIATKNSAIPCGALRIFPPPPSRLVRQSSNLQGTFAPARPADSDGSGYHPAAFHGTRYFLASWGSQVWKESQDLPVLFLTFLPLVFGQFRHDNSPFLDILSGLHTKPRLSLGYGCPILVLGYTTRSRCGGQRNRPVQGP